MPLLSKDYQKGDAHFFVASRYLIIAAALLLSSSSIAQTDTSRYDVFMEQRNSRAIKKTSSGFIVNEKGDSVKVDTIKYYYTYGKYTSKWNKSYYIYHNDKLYKKMAFYKNRLSYENFYTQGINTKRKAYSSKRPYFMEKIGYFNETGRYKIEIYNKKGELIKEIYE